MILNEKREIFQRISLAYTDLSGERFPCPPDVKDEFLWITNEAPYCLLSHDSDGNLVYINKQALKAFKYKEDSMMGMGSFITANGIHRLERHDLLNRLHSSKIIRNVHGVRVNSDDVNFNIYDGIVWEVNKMGFIGQAGLVWLGEFDEVKYKSAWT